MPERVHTRFDDGEDGHVESSVGLAKSASLKKRKAVEAFSELPRPFANSVRDSSHALPRGKGTGSRHLDGDVSKVRNGKLSIKAAGREKGGEPEEKLSRNSSTAASGKKSLPVAKQQRDQLDRGSHGLLRQRAAELLQSRKSLPIFAHKDDFRILRTKDVLLLVGETGSGKSTQVPQFLLQEPWCEECVKSVPSETHSSNGKAEHYQVKKIGGRIAITQPRRVAAISLARRVAEEMGTTLGKSSPSSQVGYSVRFDNSTSPSTRIKFVTEGMLLQEMLLDPWLTQFSAVIVDEVHERGVNVDLILAFLKVMGEDGKWKGRGGVPLKVIVMSATGNMEEIKNFFESPQTRSQPQPNHHVNGNRSASKPDFRNCANPPEGRVDICDVEDEWEGLPDEPASKRELATCTIKGRQYPVKIIYSPSPVTDIVEASLQTVFHVHLHEPLPGDILVFMTGQETVENLASFCEDRALTLDPKVVPKLLVLPLFAALPQSAQQLVFSATPHTTRKVIISTNIAETSVTVPGVHFVVDSGKCKKKQFSSRLGLDSLLVKPISRSAANQRSGRAGREGPGSCYRLYTEETYFSFEPDNDPEILRCDLSPLVLSLKARGVQDITAFPLLTSPERTALEKALLTLISLDALDSDPTSRTPVTELGSFIARLPLSPQMGAVLYHAAEPQFSCLSEAVDIISALSVENVFLSTNSEEKREEAEEARRGLYRREGDHLTLLATVQGYVAENTDRKQWCTERFVSHRAMQAVMDVRKQLEKLIKSLLPNPSSSAASANGTLPERVLRSLLTGFLSNTALLNRDGSYKTVMGRHTVTIHPSSVLFGRKCEAIMYNEFVYTVRAYARGVSAVEGGWISQALEYGN